MKKTLRNIFFASQVPARQKYPKRSGTNIPNSLSATQF